MSTVTVRILTCDGTRGGEVCPAEFGGDQSVRSLAALRRMAQEQGWRRKGYCRDLCPDCASGVRTPTTPVPQEI